MAGEELSTQSELDPPNQWEHRNVPTVPTESRPDPNPTLPDVGGTNGAGNRLNLPCILYVYLITLLAA
jgi:hypothetical protein